MVPDPQSGKQGPTEFGKWFISFWVGLLLSKKSYQQKSDVNFFIQKSYPIKNVIQNNTTLYQINDATPLYMKQMMQQISNHKGISRFFNPTSYQRNDAASL